MSRHSFLANNSMNICRLLLCSVFVGSLILSGQMAVCQDKDSFGSIDRIENTIRFATFNISFNRKNLSALRKELESGKSVEAEKVAEIIQRVRPDVLLLNEFDYDKEGRGIKAFRENFLGKSQNGNDPIDYPHVYFAPVNTGVNSAIDFNRNDDTTDAEDAFGFGFFPGQYAMVVLSKHEFNTDLVRTFQNFLWKDMPENNLPVDPKTKESYYSDEAKEVFRLSSKSHWDLPVKVGGRTIHFLVCHPTPPVFDEAEDRNGCRNFDEIRFFVDYVSGRGGYIYDDKGGKGGLKKGSDFVIAGDMNSDPKDGDSKTGAAEQLLKMPEINSSFTPASTGGAYYAKTQGRANKNHKGDPKFDTGDFNEKIGNVRIDYCLPSKSLSVKNAGVFWPKPDEPGGDLVDASDHRMVWIDIEK